MSETPNNGSMMDRALSNQDSAGMDRVLNSAHEVSQRILNAEEQAEEAEKRANLARDIDPKTQLLNFPAFKSRAGEIVAKGEIPEGRKPYYSLLLGDLDDFKSLNTSLGYIETDNAALLPVAEIFRDSLTRSDDIVGEVSRFGGEEFVALLVGTDEEGAKSVANNIQQKVNELHPLGPEKPLGMSIGLVTFSPGADIMEEFQKANDAVDKAKKIEGKNQIVSFEELPQESHSVE